MDNQKQQHEKMLYPAVRVKTQKAGGSGTVIYSQPDARNEGEYLSFALTNEHVIDSCIEVKESWDSLLKRNIKKDIIQECNVESFDYHKMSKVISSNSHAAEIIAYDKEHDIAVLKVLTPREIQNTAMLIPEDSIDELRLFQDVWCVGCSLLHDPISNYGYITGLREIIENKEYMMQSAHSIFGNSGGAVYTADKMEFLGIPSRITGIQLGFGADIITWMGFFIHPKRIYQFLKDQELHFLFDPKDDYYKSMERRKQKRERERQRLSIVESAGQEGDAEMPREEKGFTDYP